MQSGPNTTLSSPTFTLLNGVEMPLVGFGTAGLQGHGQGPLRRAVAAGFRHIDTAQADEWYDEKVVGGVLEWTPVDRESFFITTKVRTHSCPVCSLVCFVCVQARPPADRTGGGY